MSDLWYILMVLIARVSARDLQLQLTVAVTYFFGYFISSLSPPLDKHEVKSKTFYPPACNNRCSINTRGMNVKLNEYSVSVVR